MKYCHIFKVIVILIIFSGITFSAHAVDVKKPVFSVKRGFYEDAFQLKLSPEPANAVIKYTLDGSAPTKNNGLVYKDPIIISKTTFVRAISYMNGENSSSVATHTYIFLNDVINQKNSTIKGAFWSEEFDMKDVGSATEEDIKKALVDIPSISFVAETKHLFSAQGIHWASELEKRKTVPTSIEMIYPKGYKGDKFKSWQENCGLRIQGGKGRQISGKWRDLKQSFSALFKGEYGAGKLKHDIFKDAPFNARTASGTYDRIIFRAGHNDNWGNNWGRPYSTYTRDEMTRVLQLHMSKWGSHGTYVHLYLNGKYWGLYNPCERADDNMMAIYFGGDENDYCYGKAKDSYVQGAVPKYDSLLHKNFNSSTLSELGNYVDLDNFADLVILFAYANPGDGQQFYYGYNSKLNKPLLFAAWDLEASFGGGMMRTGDPSMAQVNGMYCSKNILSNPEFRLKVADRAYKYGRNDGVLVDRTVIAIWDSLNRVIEKAILCETARWGDEHGKIPNWKVARDAVRKDFTGRAGKLFNVLRKSKLYPSVDAPLFLSNSSVLEVSSLKVIPGFSLTMKTEGGVIYYTLDGSDPRKSDLSNGIASTAVKYDNSSLPFKNTTLLRARTLANGIWSPIHEIMIILQDNFKDLKMTEIHYHPSADRNGDGDNFEFIELKNTGSSPLNMTGVSFDMGIYYTFKSGVILDPGKYIVLASSDESFTKRYNFSPFGAYKGQLRNSGETVRLADAAGDLIDSVEYSDKQPWPKEADGEGYSLAPIRADRMGDPNASTTWFKSSQVNGTPGKDDPKSFGSHIITPYLVKKHTVCRIGRFCFLIPFKNDFHVSILNLQGRVITDFAQKGQLQYHWKPGISGMYFIRFTSKYGKQVVKKVMIIR
ncbi:MAG: chitobiase/beta-hexosaminidase C-terminal domain-containing protein [Chitinispirillia bacterium]